jgi:hypothetical protein
MLIFALKQLSHALLRLVDQAEDALEVWDDPLVTEDGSRPSPDGDRLLAA